jgi:tryptophan halogenase
MARVKSILIVGGGSSGWMAATYMSKFLKDIKITLIESSDIPIVGVGESTIPPIRHFMEMMGFDESDWMPKCNATYKSSIRFENFYKKGDPPFWYPFEPMMEMANRPISRYWHYKHVNDPAFANRFSFFDACFSAPALCDHGKTIKSIAAAGYAYHFDAGLLGEYLKGVAKSNGVTHIIDTITDVNLSENGDIKSVLRASGEAQQADLYIDCSGFQALLISKHLGDSFSSFEEYLFNDSAVAMRIPYIDKEKEMLSFTNCTALSAGWVWNIPLYDRIGTGYVYSSNYKTKDDAELEFRKHLGEERVKDVEAKHIKIRHGHQSSPWTRNCVAVGLAAGFIEPLESTGIHVSQSGIELLTRMLRYNCEYGIAEQELYNSSMTSLFEHIRDFLVCHYALTSRDDSDYWKDIRHSAKISEKLREKLMLARAVLPDRQYQHIYDGALVSHGLNAFHIGVGWPCILLGMNFLPYIADETQTRNTSVFEKHIEDNMHLAEQYFSQKKTKLAELINALPSHYQYLKQNIYNGQG